MDFDQLLGGLKYISEHANPAIRERGLQAGRIYNSFAEGGLSNSEFAELVDDLVFRRYNGDDPAVEVEMDKFNAVMAMLTDLAENVP